MTLIKTKYGTYSDVSRVFLGTPFSARGLGPAVMPPMGQWQSLSGGPEGKAPESFWDLVIKYSVILVKMYSKC